MLLTLTCSSSDPGELGFLLHKHPERQQTFPVNWGRVHVFYPENSPSRCTFAMLLEVDPVGLVRRRSVGLEQYVNDRPYAASSFFSVAMNLVLRDALLQKCKQRPELVARPLPLQARVAVVRCRGGEKYLRQLFEPLGYHVDCESHPLDPELGWLEGSYCTLSLSATTQVHRLLNHLYVLLPVLDAEKHYYVDDRELEKLLARGEGWLSSHPLKRSIVERYLKRRQHLTREALARLQEEQVEDPDELAQQQDETEQKLETSVRLHDVRLDRVCELLKSSGARKVVDLGCGAGKLLARLRRFRQFESIVGVDVAYSCLSEARERLNVEDGAGRLQLLHGSLLYRDARLLGCEAAALVEVIEHLDPARLEACQRHLFGFLQPRLVLVTTPNREYNALFAGMRPGQLRHRDHRFEWTRAEFQGWAREVAERHGYRVRFEGLGPEDPVHGCPSQLGVFEKC